MRRTILAIAILSSGVVVVGGIALVGMIGLRAQPTFPRPPFSRPAFASVRPQYGRRSPHETTSTDIDGATVTIVYGRPYMRGRMIFGGLVPYDEVWCPGADEATTLESTKPIQIGKLRVPVGPHTIWLLPERDEATLIISKEESGFHTRYPSRSDLGRVPFAMRTLDSDVEQLTFAIEARSSGGGAIVMTWERTELSAPFRVVQ